MRDVKRDAASYLVPYFSVTGMICKSFLVYVPFMF